MAKNQDLSSGKMSRGPSPQTKDRISRRCLKQSSVLKNRPPRCLRLKKENGPMQTTMWETDGQSAIESLTRNGGVFPNEEQESFLSQILQASVPRKYYLSPKACRGILRRASARGKELPEILQKALERQAAQDLTDTTEASQEKLVQRSV